MKTTPRRLAVGALIAMSTVAVTGCKNEALPGPQPREPDFLVRASASQALTPTYTWDGGPAASLRVQPTSAFSEPAWIIVTENANGPVDNINSSVVHGVTPTGAQPMTSVNGRFVLTYNGELYNTSEIAADLLAEARAIHEEDRQVCRAIDN